jgi:hypothetical protein
VPPGVKRGERLAVDLKAVLLGLIDCRQSPRWSMGARASWWGLTFSQWAFAPAGGAQVSVSGRSGQLVGLLGNLRS